MSIASFSFVVCFLMLGVFLMLYYEFMHCEGWCMVRLLFLDAFSG